MKGRKGRENKADLCKRATDCPSLPSLIIAKLLSRLTRTVALMGRQRKAKGARSSEHKANLCKRATGCPSMIFLIMVNFVSRLTCTVASKDR